MSGTTSTLSPANKLKLDSLEPGDGGGGQQVELQKTATHIQWRLGTGAWSNLVALSELQGAPGANGSDGSDANVTKATVEAALGYSPLDAAAKASATDLRVGTNDAKFLTPKTVADAFKQVGLDPATVAAGVDFSTFVNGTLMPTSNLTLGPPTNTLAGASGTITVTQDATGGRTLAFNSAYRLPSGGITLQTTPNGVTVIPYQVGGSGAVRLFPPSKWA